MNWFWNLTKKQLASTFATVFLAGSLLWMWQRGELPRGLQPASDWIATTSRAVFKYLDADVELRRWTHWLLLFAAYCWLPLAVFGAYHRFRRKSDYRLYVSDTIEGLRWRWKWTAPGSPNDGEPWKIQALCPQCDLALQKDEGYINLGPGSNQPPTWFCTDCRKAYGYVSTIEAKNRIMRAKDSGDWTSKVK